MPLPRTLPVTVHPGHGETFHSWLTRLAARLRLEPLNALRAIGYPVQTGTPTFPGYGVTVPETVTQEMARTTRAPGELIRATLLETFDGGPISLSGIASTAPGGNRTLGMREWVHLGASSACIACLTETGYQWQLTWRLPWAAVCTRHQLLHSNVCPGCGQPFNAGRRRDNSLGPPTNNVPRIDACPNNIRVGRGAYAPQCRHPYQDITTATCEQPTILAAQNQLDALLAAGHRTQFNDWWQDLRAVTAVLLTHANSDQVEEALPGLPALVAHAVDVHYATRDRVDEERAAVIAATGSHRSAPRQRTQMQAPTNPALVAALMPIALGALRDLKHVPQPLAEADSGPLAAELGLELINRAVSSHRNGRHRTLNGELRLRCATPDLLAALAQRSDYNTLTRRRPAIQYTLHPNHLPRLWPHHLFQQVAPLFAQVRTTDDMARTFLSLCAAKLLTGGTWAEAGQALHWDPRRAVGTANANTTRLTAAGLLAEVQEHVHHGLRVMQSMPPADLVDYRARATQHTTTTSVSKQEWDRLCVDSGVALQGTAARRRNLAAWRWHTHALMPLNEWPGWDEMPNRESAKEVYRRFVSDVLPKLQAA